ncbi:MAG: ribonuclease P protein component [Verrucomicrobiae bacterium]|nr:ribonuclease P protein component [Verrucomicrobiae bacterium]MDW8310286.1 ribonuclease P protein component [Verrucomicrobiales bacterium]
MSAAAKPLALPRSRRLKQSREFAQVRRDGERLVHGCLIANWRRLAPGAVSRLGVVTGRALGRAVIRNRARRWLREAFRVHQAELTAPVELVLVARPSILKCSWRDVENDFLTVMRRAGLLKPDAASALAAPQSNSLS